MLEIDGSYGEGGGQIIRTAISLSMVFNTDIKIFNIRSNRSKPGLAAQHITAIKAAALLCKGTTSDIHVGSDKLLFRPGKIQNRDSSDYTFNIGTAGSITLVLQTCILPLLFAHSDTKLKIKISGGTDVQWSPPFDYFKSIFLKHLKTIGAEVDTTLIRRGYYPRGGGEVILNVKGLETRMKFRLTDRGTLQKIDGTINLSSLPHHIADRIKTSAINQIKLQKGNEIPIEIDIIESGNSFSPGTGIVLRSIFQSSVLGSSSLGRKGTSAEQVGAHAAAGLNEELNGHGAVDIFAVDQLIPYLGLLGGSISVRKMTSHTNTNIWLVEQFTGAKFQIEELPDKIMISM